MLMTALSAAAHRLRCPTCPGTATADVYMNPPTPTGPQTQAPSAPARRGSVIDRDVRVTVFRPSTASRNAWHPLPVFVHRAGVADQVAVRAASLIGPDADRFVALGQDARTYVRRGCQIVVEAWFDGATCNPEFITFKWLEPSHEALFRFRYDGNAEIVRGGVRVFADKLLLADVSLTVAIDTGVEPDGRPPPIEALTVLRHRRVFVSYSHKDKAVVDQVTSAARTLGDDYVIDGDVLRSGEDWSTRLDEHIRSADAFQLFWSTNSMRSPQVQREWTVALLLGRENFVRPVYWQVPRPEAKPHLPPPELDRLHFTKFVRPRRGLLLSLRSRLGRRGDTL